MSAGVTAITEIPIIAMSGQGLPPTTTEAVTAQAEVQYIAAVTGEEDVEIIYGSPGSLPKLYADKKDGFGAYL